MYVGDTTRHQRADVHVTRSTDAQYTLGHADYIIHTHPTGGEARVGRSTPYSRSEEM